MSIYIFIKMFIFHVILNKYKGTSKNKKINVTKKILKLKNNSQDCQFNSFPSVFQTI